MERRETVETTCVESGIGSISMGVVPAASTWAD